MNLKLYTNFSDNQHIEKDIRLLGETTFTLKEYTSVVDPVLIVKLDTAVISSLNYVYIEEFKRYYYVTNISAKQNGLWELSCHCDVLMSFADKIKEQVCLVSRQEYDYNLNLSDPRLKCEAAPITEIVEFPQGFSFDWSYVMVILGN